MAIPTIGSLTPSSGPAGGRNFVTIAGTNFRAQTAAPTLGSTVGYESPVSVRVRVAGEDVWALAIVSTTELRVEMPPYRGTVQANDPVVLTASSVEVTNLDDVGAAIPTETVTAAGVYTYVREPLLPPRATLAGQIYRRVAEAVVALFRQQVHPNVQLADVSLDFAASGTTVVYGAALPSITLEGPVLGWDFWRSTQHQRYVWDAGAGLYKAFYPPATRLLEFRMRALADTKAEVLAIQRAIEAVFMRNGYLRVDPNPAAPSGTRDVYPLALTDPPAIAPGTAGANLSTLTAVFQVRGVDFELPEEHARTDKATALRQENQQGLTDDPPAALEAVES